MSDKEKTERRLVHTEDTLELADRITIEVAVQEHMDVTERYAKVDASIKDADIGDEQIKETFRELNEYMVEKAHLRITRFRLSFPPVLAREMAEGRLPDSTDEIELEPLTKRQFEIVRFYDEYVKDESKPPTIREAADGLGVKSPATIHEHLGELEGKGWIRRDKHKARSVDLTPPAKGWLEERERAEKEEE